jgi:hypothetical protein
MNMGTCELSNGSYKKSEGVCPKLWPSKPFVSLTLMSQRGIKHCTYVLSHKEFNRPFLSLTFLMVFSHSDLWVEGPAGVRYDNWTPLAIAVGLHTIIALWALVGEACDVPDQRGVGTHQENMHQT